MLSNAVQAVPSAVLSPAQLRFRARGRTNLVRSPAAYFTGNAEPTLDEMFADPMVRHLMDRDGVQVESLLVLLGEVRDRLR